VIASVQYACSFRSYGKYSQQSAENRALSWVPKLDISRTGPSRTIPGGLMVLPGPPACTAFKTTGERRSNRGTSPAPPAKHRWGVRFTFCPERFCPYWRRRFYLCVCLCRVLYLRMSWIVRFRFKLWLHRSHIPRHIYFIFHI
jgi:hypothetical protein